MHRQRSKSFALAFAGTLLFAALSGCTGDADADRPPRTERERDSLIGQSILPGAGGVRGALEASDTAAARAARLDSIGNPD